MLTADSLQELAEVSCDFLAIHEGRMLLNDLHELVNHPRIVNILDTL